MNVSERVDSLQVEIDKKRQEIRSDSYLMSVGEWISLYRKAGGKPRASAVGMNAAAALAA
jgi:hypothetical protein